MICDADKLSDILDEEMINKLCDCGRHKKKTLPAPPRRERETFQTAYDATFHQHPEVRPRSSKRPPPSPRDPNPPPMTFDTNQRSQFKPIRNAERAKLAKQEESYSRPSDQMEFNTSYKREFIPKESDPGTRRMVAPPDTRSAPSGRMAANKTTSQEHFKQWVAQPQLAFQELPSFAGSILYPEKAPLPESTARNSYRGQYAPPLDTTKASASACNIVLEGDMDLDTTTREDYRGFSGTERVLPINPQARTTNFPKGRFRGESQSKHDFPGFKDGRQPLPPKPIDPPQPTIDLKFNNRLTFDTEQRTTFRGHDIRKHPATKSCKKDEGNFEPSTAKFETQTSQRRDYMPIDLDKAYTARVSQPVSRHQVSGKESKFEGTTMNNVFFKDWGPQTTTRPRYGDFHESHKYIPSVEPFTGESTSRKTYTPKQAEAIKNYKPSSKPTEAIGDFDFDTEYRKSYITKEPLMCKAQAFIIQKELARRQAAQKHVKATGKVM